MSQQYPTNWKQCATCMYWTGNRKTNTFGEWAEVDSPMAKGKCACRNSGWTDYEKQANASCASFQKWSVLK